MSSRPAMALLVREAQIATAAALAAAELVATHGIIPSLSFERMFGFLQEAQVAVEMLEEAMDGRISDRCGCFCTMLDANVVFTGARGIGEFGLLAANENELESRSV